MEWGYWWAIWSNPPGRRELTSAVVVARMRETLVKLQVAVVAGESRPAVALIGSDGVLTDAVDARLQDAALVHVALAVAPGESLRAGARVVGHGVDARPSVLARIVHAVVDVVQAQSSGESQRAAALEAVDQIEALLPFRALDGEALVDVVLAVEALVTCATHNQSISLLILQSAIHFSIRSIGFRWSHPIDSILCFSFLSFLFLIAGSDLCFLGIRIGLGPDWDEIQSDSPGDFRWFFL